MLPDAVKVILEEATHSQVEPVQLQQMQYRMEQDKELEKALRFAQSPLGESLNRLFLKLYRSNARSEMYRIWSNTEGKTSFAEIAKHEIVELAAFIRDESQQKVLAKSTDEWKKFLGEEWPQTQEYCRIQNERDNVVSTIMQNVIAHKENQVQKEDTSKEL